MKTEKITFGAGCFWHTEHAFRKVKGVVKTAVGYMGGNEKKYPNPSYNDVCSGKTGYAEVCEVEYNPEKVSAEELLEIFWKMHDPAQVSRQGPDIGEQYRSAIFYRTGEQKKAAEKSMKKEQKKLGKKIATEILPAGKFNRAEEYHQDYMGKNAAAGCGI
jgi:peptide-methionine (S)-S-oxide reductase